MSDYPESYDGCCQLIDDVLVTRKLVAQAKGILMESLNLTEEEAVRALVRATSDPYPTLRDVAEGLIAGYSDPPAEADGVATISSLAGRPSSLVS